MTPWSRIWPSVSNSVSTIVGREAERRLVEQQHVGPREQRAGDRELLLLAAGERAGVAAARSRRRPGRGACTHARSSSSAVARAAPGEPEAQVLVDGQRGEDVAPLGHERDARAGDRPRARPRSERAVEQDLAAGDAGRAPMIACSVVDLPAPFGPISPTISPRLDLEAEAAHRGDGAVADLERRERRSSDDRRLRHPRPAPEVGGRDVDVRPDLVRRPLGERAPAVEHVDRGRRPP